ncbi:MAG: AI-2E family transporter [Candidatus Roizmanbacteria bacterium]
MSLKLKRWLNLALYATFILFLIYVFYISWSQLTWFIFGAILAYAGYPFVKIIEQYLKRYKVNHTLGKTIGIMIFYIIIITCIYQLFTNLGGVIITQINRLISQLSDTAPTLEGYLRESQKFIPIKFNPDEVVRFGLTKIQDTVGLASTFAFGTVASAASFVLSIIFLPFWIFFLLFESESIIQTCMNLIPERFRTDIRIIGHITDSILKKYLIGQVLICSIIGAVTWIWFSAIGLPYALILGIVTAILMLIPVLGGVLAWILALLTALPSGTNMMLLVSLITFVIQQIAMSILIPRIQGKVVNLPIWLTLLIVGISNILGGIIGMIIGLPLIAVLMTIVYYIHLRLLPESESPTMIHEKVTREQIEFKQF